MTAVSLTLAGAAAVGAAGLAAGALNTVVGAGSLVTFPTLLAFGYGSVTANVSNTVGLVFGSISGAVGYRKELHDQGRITRSLLPSSVLGGATGGVLLLLLPKGVFDAVVPALVLLAALLVYVQPRLSAGVAARGRGRADAGPVLVSGVYLAGVYGGYFGAAQGVLLIGLLGVLLPVGLQQANAIKNVLAGAVNAVAALYFVFAARIAWEPAIIIAISSVLGGVIGARYGRRMPPRVLRVVVVIVGIGVALVLLLRGIG